MKAILTAITISLISISTFATSVYPEDVLNCVLPKCDDCQLLVDVKIEKAQYFNGESSHLMAQVSKNEKTRTFTYDASPEFPLEGYRVVFHRKQKTADLYQVKLDKTETAIDKNLKCQFGNNKLTL